MFGHFQGALKPDSVVAAFANIGLMGCHDGFSREQKTKIRKRGLYVRNLSLGLDSAMCITNESLSYEQQTLHCILRQEYLVMVRNRVTFANRAAKMIMLTLRQCFFAAYEVKLVLS